MVGVNCHFFFLDLFSLTLLLLFMLANMGGGSCFALFSCNQSAQSDVTILPTKFSVKTGAAVDVKGAADVFHTHINCCYFVCS